MTYIEAFIRNMGTWGWMPREKFKQRTCKNESTDANHRGGLTGSSDEAFVMKVERSGQHIQAN